MLKLIPLIVAPEAPEALPPTKIVDTYNCEIGTAVGDIVHLSATEGNKVLVSVSNIEFQPSIGVVIDVHVSGTICSVQTYGKCDLIFVGLPTGIRVYLSDVGFLTTTPTPKGYVQLFGMSYDVERLFIHPMHWRVKRTPFL